MSRRCPDCGRWMKKAYRPIDAVYWCDHEPWYRPETQPRVRVVYV